MSEFDSGDDAPAVARVRARALALCAPIFWSLSGVTIRQMDDPDPWQINFYRSGALALFVMAVLVWRYRRWSLWTIRSAGRKGVIAGFCLSGALLLNVVALTMTSVANAIVVLAGGPVFAAALGWVLLRERVAPATGVAIALTLVGMTVMVGGSVGSVHLLGDLIAIAGVVCFGAYTVALRVGAEIDMMPAVMHAGLISALIAGSVAIGTGVGLAASRTDIALSAMLGVVQIGVGGVMFAAASRHLPAAELALYAVGEPVLGPLWAWLWAGETPAIATLVGGAIILVGFFVQIGAGGRRQLR